MLRRLNNSIQNRNLAVACCLAMSGLLFGTSLTCFADDSSKQTDSPEAKATTAGKLIPLNKEKTVLIDRSGNRVLIKSKVVLREGLLEMLCCLKGTKEHESILSTTAKAYVIHAGLLALGAEPGKPVRFYPDYIPAKGQELDIYVQWTDKKGKFHRVKSQTLIRYAVLRYYYHKMEKLPADLVLPEKGEGDLRYDKFNKELYWYGQMADKQHDEFLKLSADKTYQTAINSFYKESQPRVMDTKWIFTGSHLVTDEETSLQHYLAEDGCVICVANMPTAMVDVQKQSSSQGQESLLFEPFTERIPPLGTEVTIELIPVPKKNNLNKK